MSTPHSTWAEHYDAVYEGMFGDLYRTLTDLTLRRIEASVRPRARIVDFGAGTGRLAVPLALRGYEVTAVDPCEAMLRQLKLKAGTANVVTCASRMQDYRTDQPFDMALCVFTVLLYLLDEQSLRGALEAASRALRSRGLLMIDVPMAAAFSGYHTIWEDMDRRVEVTPLENGLYRYRERTTLGVSGKTYEDSFSIRYWEEGQVLKYLAEQGFAIRDDLSGEFDGSGSHYFLIEKQDPNPGNDGFLRSK
jgi:SAM-dependent methyltransferase